MPQPYNEDICHTFQCKMTESVITNIGQENVMSI
jgi:hypothetical protein